MRTNTHMHRVMPTSPPTDTHTHTYTHTYTPFDPALHRSISQPYASTPNAALHSAGHLAAHAYVMRERVRHVVGRNARMAGFLGQIQQK